MMYVMDTHILLWSFFEPEKLPRTVAALVADPENAVGISQVSIWEISLKFSLGKLRLGDLAPDGLKDEILANGYRILPLVDDDLFEFYKLPLETHRDPFDRLLIWQCVRNGHTLLSRDRRCEAYRQHGLAYLA